MKVISKETAPTVEFGDKVRTKVAGSYGDIEAGVTGVILSRQANSDGHTRVDTADNYDFFKPEDLEVLHKFSGEEVEAEKTVTVEFTVTELMHVVADMGINSIANTERGLEMLGFNSEMNAAVAQRTYSDLKDLLMEVA
ncbi:hypothetical protein [Enterococcus entomosocium]|uniref:hypothetical protein n=1 Tax=Enterococcus entomosocium TaxID=3034352 RepID=UPI002649F627|nr:hypothetical protein [Enterococcus entomosocium]